MSFLPWYNYKLIDFLENYLTNKMDIFEYGGGNSTLYYSGRVKSVSTIEIKSEWIDFVTSNQKTNNIEIKLCSNIHNFSEEINNFHIKMFDIIVIDSRDRAKCLTQCIKFLKPAGIIILDNSERKNLTSARQDMIERKFIEKIYSGIRNDGLISTSSVFSQDCIF